MPARWASNTTADALVAGFLVAADVHFRLRDEHRDFLQPIDQCFVIGDVFLAQNTSPSRLTEISTFSGLSGDDVALLRQFHRHRMRYHRDGDQEMISSTSITSTSGVVLIDAFSSSSSLPAAGRYSSP